MRDGERQRRDRRRRQRGETEMRDIYEVHRETKERLKE